VFGGLTFMLGGHMCCGIVGETLMVRPGASHRALDRPRPAGAYNRIVSMHRPITDHNWTI
jgi:hypothetical protein